ncbi:MULTISPECIES: CocE/NonD family hydrolase [unclassified Streptomyces]|uniref:CocE/NonD family hydrolase n=1 Tax=unclassified Streptomyces TaxID=2593676 RepID=UPI0025B37271|nr:MULTISPECIES: CocE/NonD family hydrolase [unclassified Streptomyces]MDN3246067.1 CocE/NonD family hydrolase [Streptomyces sp. ZSW22]MDN3257768.1 CocE/NonD family hydrolase [Streptomyces sp. MA25(2023)]
MRARRAAVRSASALIATLALTAGLAGPAVAAREAEAPPVATATDPVTHEENDRVPEGSVWTQHYFPSSDRSGTQLHADVLLPEGLSRKEKVPVILSVGPYFAHAGQTGPEGWAHTGPSARFNDFIEGTDLFDERYAFVMVDLRGFGGSTGCLDWGGPGEQADVRAAIDWAAKQPWSTGAVGMYGKSYDAVTGLIGNNLDQRALKAVVAQEPLWDMYQYIYSNGVPRPNVTGTAGAYNSIATMPPMADDDPRYRVNARYEEDHPECLTENSAGYRISDQRDDHWTSRDLARMAKGSDTPLFVTQGFIENNTKPEEMQEYLDNHEGPERGWLGQWDHVRGGDRTPDGRLAMGREGWYEETLSFYDRYLKGIRPDVRYPAYAVEDSTGAWRAQRTWPVTERSVTLPLDGGSYVDDGGASARAALTASGRPAPRPPAPPAGRWDMENAPATEHVAPRGLAEESAKRQRDGEVGSSFFVWSKPLEKPVRVTGTPQVSLTAKGEGNVMLKLYDVAPDGTAVMFDEQVSLLHSGRLTVDLKATDWTLAAGHVLAVEVGSIQTGSWRDTPSGETVEVRGARLRLALDDPADDVATPGDRSPFLDTYLRQYTVELPAGPGTFTVVPGGRL